MCKYIDLNQIDRNVSPLVDRVYWLPSEQFKECEDGCLIIEFNSGRIVMYDYPYETFEEIENRIEDETQKRPVRWFYDSRLPDNEDEEQNSERNYVKIELRGGIESLLKYTL